MMNNHEKGEIIYNDEQWSSMDGLDKRRLGLGGAQHPPFADKMIGITMPYCKDSDDMTRLCYGKRGWPLKKRAVRGEQPPHLQTR